MLLELAYGASFQSLRDSQEHNIRLESQVVDFIAARKLADEVGTTLGSEFASIVKKCLRCDFGCGEDLDDPQLQARLYEDVVCKLDELEEGFRKLQLGVLTA